MERPSWTLSRDHLFYSKLSRGRSSAKFCGWDDCILSRIVALSKTRLQRKVLKYRNGSDLPLKDKKYI